MARDTRLVSILVFFSEMTKFYGDDEIVNLFFRVAEQLQKFNLTKAERALFTVITLLSPGTYLNVHAYYC